MRSIRQKLTQQILVCLMILYGIGGFAVYQLLGAFLLNQLDKDLLTWVGTTSEMYDFEDEETVFHFYDTVFDVNSFENGTRYFQVWNENKKVIARSLSLEKRDLLFVDVGLDENIFFNTDLAQDIKGRAIAISYINCRPTEEEFFQSHPAEDCNRLFMVLACSREWIDEILGITF